MNSVEGKIMPATPKRTKGRAAGFRGRLARRLSVSSLGSWALSEEADLGVFKSRPSPRVLLGLALIASSYIGGPSCLAYCVFAAQSRGEVLLWSIGAASAMAVVHLIFAAGVYFAGGNYAKAVLRWALSGFIKKHSPL